MIYLSQLIQKPIYFHGKWFGKVLDIAVVENRTTPPVSKIVIQKDKKKLTIPPSALLFENGHFVLKNQHIPFLPYDANDFYLAEDLLDKQVIDIDGRRVVRVNDVLLEGNDELKVMGIDVGALGILRRLGIDRMTPLRLKAKTLPWSLIQAFDYQTGSIQIRISQNKLNSFHPAEIAEMLEEVGTKERLGIVNVLDAQKAAIAIENADNNTQISILEQLSPSHLKEIANRMLVSEIADIFYKLNPLRLREITRILGSEKVNRVKKLSAFPDDVAGGLMRLSFYTTSAHKTVKEVVQDIRLQDIHPEVVIVVNENDRFIGTILTKDLLLGDSLAILQDIVLHKHSISPETSFPQILTIFSQYNLRLLPVVDREKQILGTISIDTVLEQIEELEEKNDII